MEIQTETNDKQEYIEKWESYLNPLYMLCFTPSQELSKEMKETLDKVKVLISKVSDDKDLS